MHVNSSSRASLCSVLPDGKHNGYAWEDGHACSVLACWGCLARLFPHFPAFPAQRSLARGLMRLTLGMGVAYGCSLVGDAWLTLVCALCARLYPFTLLQKFGKKFDELEPMERIQVGGTIGGEHRKTQMAEVRQGYWRRSVCVGGGVRC